MRQYVELALGRESRWKVVRLSPVAGRSGGKMICGRDLFLERTYHGYLHGDLR